MARLTYGWVTIITSCLSLALLIFSFTSWHLPSNEVLTSYLLEPFPSIRFLQILILLVSTTRDQSLFLKDDTITGGKVDLWLGYHHYLLLITSFTNLLIYFMAPTLQWSIDKLLYLKLFPSIRFLRILILLVSTTGGQSLFLKDDTITG